MGKAFRHLLVTALIGVTLALSPASGVATAGDRPPMPAAAQLARAEATIKKLFRDEYERRTPADRQALARKLLAEGHDTPNDAAARYVCYREAHDLATLGGDLPTAFTAANAIARDFAVDPRDVQKMKVATYLAIARQVDTTEANAALAEVGLNLLGRLVALEEFDDADRLLVPIQAAANKTKQVALVTRVQSSGDEAAELRRNAQKVTLAAETLKKTPGDAEANLTVGRHLAFAKGSWSEALPLLAKSSDPVLKDLASRELAKPADAKSELQLADGWRSLAGKQTGLAQTNVERHAQELYQQAATRPPAATVRPPAVAPGVGAATAAPPIAVTQPAEPAGGVSRYWWTPEHLNPPGMRVWHKISADSWQEVGPGGRTIQFQLVSHDDPQLGSGDVVRNVKFPALEVWVPKLVEGNSTYYRNSGGKWVLMGAIHLGDPPAPGM